MKRLRIVPVLIIFSLLLSGCVGREPNEIAYVVALGIDNGENGDYRITIQYANPSEISGGEEGGDAEKSGVENLTLQSPDIYAAVGLADQLESKSFSLSHTKLIVVSRETAEKGLKNITENFLRNDELRPDVYLAVAEDGAQEYLENVNPATEVNTAKYYRLIFDKNKLIGLPKGTIKNFFCGTDTGDYDLLLPIAHTSADKNIGSAVFRGGEMVGKLDTDETEIYRLLDKDNAAGYFTLQNDDTLPEPVTIKTVQQKMPKYKIDHENKIVYVRLELEGDLYTVPDSYNIDTGLNDFEKACGDHIANECKRVMEKILREYRSDAFRLNERSKMMFLTNEDYEEFKKRVDYSQYEVYTEVKFDIRRTGLIVKQV